MNHKFEARMQREIRRRAFESADRLRQEKQNQQNTEYTLDALKEVTGLPRPNVESIAEEVKRSRQMIHDDFFSIKIQILMTCGLAGFIVILGAFVYII